MTTYWLINEDQRNDVLRWNFFDHSFAEFGLNHRQKKNVKKSSTTRMVSLFVTILVAMIGHELRDRWIVNNRFLNNDFTTHTLRVTNCLDLDFNSCRRVVSPNNHVAKFNAVIVPAKEWHQNCFKWIKVKQCKLRCLLETLDACNKFELTSSHFNSLSVQRLHFIFFKESNKIKEKLPLIETYLSCFPFVHLRKDYTY